MILTLNRKLHDGFTEGVLFVDGLYFCDTLEDQHRVKKVQNETCIPYGRYDVRLTVSNRFKKLLPEVLNVAGFSGIRIHAGNTPADTAGCILVGEKYSDGVLKSSRDTMARLMNVLEHAINKKGETVQIEIL